MDHSNPANNPGCTKKYTTIFLKKPYEWWGKIIALKLVGLILSIRSCLPGTDDTSSLKIEALASKSSKRRVIQGSVGSHYNTSQPSWSAVFAGAW